jgi:hypothetical protein
MQWCHQLYEPCGHVFGLCSVQVLDMADAHEFLPPSAVLATSSAWHKHHICISLTIRLAQQQHVQLVEIA